MAEWESASYRDRGNRVFYEAGGVYRLLDGPSHDDWRALQATAFFRRSVAEGKIVPTTEIEAALPCDAAPTGHWVAMLQHDRVPFISHPHEWSFGMLRDAALLQLELLGAALEENLILKDGTAFNVQWRGTAPTFIDIPSFESLGAGRPWPGYRQFCQTMLYPLMLTAYKGVPFQPWLRGSLEGIAPEQILKLMSWRDWFRPGVLLHVYLHAKLEQKLARSPRDVTNDLQATGFTKSMLRTNVDRLSTLVRKLRWEPAQSAWSQYAGEDGYSDADRERKKRFVRDVVHSRRRELVWDLGCNLGVYSRIAAEKSDYVIALDSDPLVIERLYQSLKADRNQYILPLVNSVSDPSPNLGWRGTERKELRQRGRPDLTLCLALLHHVVIGANIPLVEFLDSLAELESELVIEFVAKSDPKVQALLAKKPDRFWDYDAHFFERCLRERFEVQRRETLESGTRTLYHAAPKLRS